jgi:hypothetical protein
MKINRTETATVLAALRLWQQALELNDGHPPADLFDTATDCGRFIRLDTRRIDELCAKINTERALMK